MKTFSAFVLTFAVTTVVAAPPEPLPATAYYQADMEGRLQPLYDRYANETDPDEKERVARELWLLGDGEMLIELALAHERRGDWAGAYAHWYALAELVKFNVKRQPPDPEVRGPMFANVHKQLTAADKHLSAEQRKAAVSHGKQILYDNGGVEGCCIEM